MSLSKYINIQPPKKFDYRDLWMVFAIAVIVIFAIIGGNWLDGLAAITNVVCVILVARRSMWNFPWGIAGVVLYGYLAYEAGYFANTVLNLVYYLPMNLVAWYAWNGNKDEESKVIIKPMKKSEMLIVLVVLIVGTYLAGAFMKDVGGLNSYPDAFTAIASIIAMYLLARRMKEQWYLWILVNMVSIWLWNDNYVRTGEGLALITMWSIMLGNSICGLNEWVVNPWLNNRYKKS